MDNLVLDRILLVGDSITQLGCNPELNGWTAAMENAWIRRLEVMNRGFSGYTTKWWLSLIDRILHNAQQPECKIALATVFLGANDAAFNETQYVPFEDYIENIKYLVKELQKCCKRIILICPPPVDTEKWPDREYTRVKSYRDGCISFAKSTGIPVIDTWTVFLGPELIKDQSKLDGLLCDGLHLSFKGNTLL
jgi:lysophospholipase L1-like esterase